ncbi:MAG: ABC transporter ATP-binding protein [Deltaproteobacteria bacterium]|nr:ABC transporter ATP-binding protein [Deltaproteobacteria bacterium]
MIAVSDLTVRYGKRLAVDRLSLSVAPGEIVGLLGPNGAGKSTTMMAIAGVCAIDGGKISVDGVDITTQPERALRRLGVADQPPTLYEFLTVSEHLAFVAEARGKPDPARADGLLARLGLGDAAKRLCRELSFGMRQRVSLAAALVGDVAALLIDESLNGLDPHAARAGREVIEAAAAEGAAVIMSTHLLGIAERVCSRLIIMEAGRIKREVVADELAELRKQGAGALEELYLGLVGASAT